MFKQMYFLFAALLSFAVLFVACENSGSIAVDGNDIDDNIKTSNGGNYPTDLYYSEHHEWVKIDGNDAIVGMTDFAASKFNKIMAFTDGILEDDDDVIIARPPRPDTTGKTKEPGYVWPVLAPVGGLAGGTNPLLENDPDIIRRDPYGNGWCVRINQFNVEDLDYLMDAASYEAYVESLEE